MADNNNQSTSDSSIDPPSQEQIRRDIAILDRFGIRLEYDARRFENQSFRDEMSPEEKKLWKDLWNFMYIPFKNRLLGRYLNTYHDENTQQKLRDMLRKVVKLHKLLDQQDAEEAVEKYGLLQFLE